MTFRLSRDVYGSLDYLSSALSVTKTRIVEESVRAYSPGVCGSSCTGLCRYAGILSEDEADSLLTDIRGGRKGANSKRFTFMG